MTGPAPTEAEACAVLLAVEGLGPGGLGALIGALGSGIAILAAAAGSGARRRIAAAGAAEDRRPALKREVADRIVDELPLVPDRLARLRDSGLAVVTVHDPAYPARLRSTAVPPPVLFIRGTLAGVDAARVVAIVGTRRPSDHGRAVAARIAANLAKAGATVVSGLAVGIDGAAHAAAADVPAPTIAVLGSGHDRLYPRAHVRLARRIVEAGGAILSEQWPDDRPATWSFPRRNRVISGLSDATIVVEAGETSGALITAKWALEQGRDLFVVPGRIDDPQSAGCLRWLREYPGEARIIAGIPELLQDLAIPGISDGAARDARGRPIRPSLEAVLLEVGATARSIGGAIAAGHGSLDELVAVTGLEPATVLGGITLLELRGLVTSAFGRYRAAGPLLAAPPAGRAAGFAPA